MRRIRKLERELDTEQHSAKSRNGVLMGYALRQVDGAAAMCQEDIQLARAADCEAVSACVRVAYAHYIERIGQKPAPMSADYAALIARGVVYVIRESGTPGVRGVLVITSNEDAMFIENVAVDPRHQGQGLGHLLLTFAESLAMANGLRQIRLYTHELMTENIAYYGRFGYEVVDRRIDEGFRRVFMTKVLL
jgi:GNAT superfamily N-acetyltransferase